MYLSMVYTVKSRYKALQFTMLNSTAQIIAGIEADYQSEAELTKTHHTSAWRASYTWTYITYSHIVLPKWLTACVSYPTEQTMTNKSCLFLWTD